MSSHTYSHPHAARNEAIVIAHAVLGCLAWAFIVPVGGIILRLNLKSRWILWIHGILQLTAYVAYIAAVALGAWMCDNFSSAHNNMWNDPHVQLGLAILGIAFFLPPLGYAHHVIYKRRAVDQAAGLPSKPPGRTLLGTSHLWLGRVLIILGMINGGLGIQLAEKSPYQKWVTLRKAAIGYGVGCAVVAVIYCAIVIPWELKKHGRQPAGLIQEEKSSGYTTSSDASPTDSGSEKFEPSPGKTHYVIS